MASLIVGWLGRAGEDELARIDSFVDCPAHVVPDPRLELPLVDEPGSVTLKNQARIQFGGVASCFVNVEQHLAVGDLTGGFGLPAGLRSLDKDRTGGMQPFPQLGIRYS
jgi:hypothetical protein